MIFSPEQIRVTNFIACHDETRACFKKWALSLQPDLDGGEYGVDEFGVPLPQSAYVWVLRQNVSEHFAKDGVYKTFIFLDKETNAFLATGSIVFDDRDIARNYDIPGMGFWGFFNVRRDLRGRGLGTIVANYMDNHIQQFVDSSAQPCDFNLFTTNEIAVRIYSKLGFKFVRKIHIAEYYTHEDLYSKRYSPRWKTETVTAESTILGVRT